MNLPEITSEQQSCVTITYMGADYESCTILLEHALKIILAEAALNFNVCTRK